MENWPLAAKGMDAAHLLAAQSMVEGINQGLVEIFGPSAGEALGYYADPRMAPTAPLQYQRDLRLILGAPSQGIICRLRDKMCEIARAEAKAGCADLNGCLDCIARSLAGEERPQEGHEFEDYVGRFQCGLTRTLA